MPRRKYTIKPTGMFGQSAKGSHLSTPSLYGIFTWDLDETSKNFMVRNGVARKRWGLGADRTTISNFIYGIADFIEKDGTTHNLFITDKDIGKRETGTSNTFSYKTDTYTTGTITSIAADTPTAGKSTVTGSGTDWVNEAIGVADKFIMDDDHDADSEVDANWATVDSVTDATHLVLTSNYTKNGSTYKLRRLFTGPTSPSFWSYATVDDRFCFTNSNTHVWNWSGSGYATALDSTNATGFKYCIDYADRLLLAHKDGQPTLIQWSKNNDPTDWTDSTAGSAELLGTGDGITGLSKVGNSLLIYSRDAIVFGNLTGIPTAPIAFPTIRRGVGNWAPMGVVHARGTNFFVGRDNFYRLDGMIPTAIGDAVAEEFFENISAAEIPNIWGIHNKRNGEIMWIENSGWRAVAWNYRDNAWSVYRFGVGGHKTGGHWTISGEKEVMMSSSDDIAIYSPDYTADVSTAIPTLWVTPTLDLSDQDPEAENKWKTIYKVRLTITDRSASTDFALKIRVDGDDDFSASDDGTATFGDGDGRVKSMDFDVIKTCRFFQLYIINSNTDKDVQLEKIEVFYELGGEYYAI
jgi:hypothetical protein